MSKILKVKNLNYSFGKHIIFDKLSFEISNGDFVTFIDSDNNGKSVLANILACNDVGNYDITIFNKILNKKNCASIRKEISFVSENIDGMFLLTNVQDNIIFVLEKKGLSKEKIDLKINEIIKPLRLSYLLKKNNSELSLGEKYLISIFISIACEPRILILDNAFSMLDFVMKRKLFILLKSLNKKGMTILNFTSDNNEILEGKNVIIIKNGKILLCSSVKNAFDDIKIYEDNKICLPFIVELSLKLKYYGKLNQVHLNMKKLVNALWQ